MEWPSSVGDHLVVAGWTNQIVFWQGLSDSPALFLVIHATNVYLSMTHLALMNARVTVPIRPRSRRELHPLRTFFSPGATLRRGTAARARVSAPLKTRTARTSRACGSSRRDGTGCSPRPWTASRASSTSAGAPRTSTTKVRSIHWSPYDRVRVVNADP